MQHSKTRQAKQKICANRNHHWSKTCSFLCVQTNWVCPSGTQRYCKNYSDSSHWLWLKSSHFVKNMTRVESPFFSTWLELSPSHHKSWLESSHWLESRYHW